MGRRCDSMQRPRWFDLGIGAWSQSHIKPSINVTLMDVIIEDVPSPRKNDFTQKTHSSLRNFPYPRAQAPVRAACAARDDARASPSNGARAHRAFASAACGMATFAACFGNREGFRRSAQAASHQAPDSRLGRCCSSLAGILPFASALYSPRCSTTPRIAMPAQAALAQEAMREQRADARIGPCPFFAACARCVAAQIDPRQQCARRV